MTVLNNMPRTYPASLVLVWGKLASIWNLRKALCAFHTEYIKSMMNTSVTVYARQSQAKKMIPFRLCTFTHPCGGARLGRRRRQLVLTGTSKHSHVDYLVTSQCSSGFFLIALYCGYQFIYVSEYSEILTLLFNLSYIELFCYSYGL